MSKLKIFIGMPIYREAETEAINSVYEKVVAPNDLFEVIDFCQYRESPNIYMQRYNLAKAFLRTNADYFLYYDADQVIESPDNAMQILIEDNKDIISPLIVRRIFPNMPAVLTYERKRVEDRGKYLPFEDYRKYGTDKPYEVYYCCGGVVLIKRKVIEAVDRPFLPVFNNRGDMLSTDYSFFYKARNRGFKCWIEPRLLVSHIGKYRYTPADYYELIDSGLLVVEKDTEGIYTYRLKQPEEKRL